VIATIRGAVNKLARRVAKRFAGEAHDLLMRAYDVKVARLRKTAAAVPDESGVTVVTVNFNTMPFLQILYRATRRHAPHTLPIIVVDNASSDGSARWLRDVSRRDQYLSVVQLGRNVGHGPALDLGFLRARTEFVLSLDVDAFPIADNWLAAVINPLKAGSAVAGGFSNGYIHPSYLAMRRRHFIEAQHTFEASYNRRRQPLRSRYGHYDAGQLISFREPEALQHRIMPTSRRGPKSVGTVFGDVVYHNFYSARFTAGALFAAGNSPDLRRPNSIQEEDMASAWVEALEKYSLTDDGDVPGS
jgi:glycosyltransferase involved in cell wall biosynthesis